MKATQSEERTRLVLRTKKHQLLLAIWAGNSSSIPRARGFNSNAYLFHVKEAIKKSKKRSMYHVNLVFDIKKKDEQFL